MNNCIGLMGRIFGHDVRPQLAESIPPDKSSHGEFTGSGASYVTLAEQARLTIEAMTTKRYAPICKRCGRNFAEQPLSPTPPAQSTEFKRESHWLARNRITGKFIIVYRRSPNLTVIPNGMEDAAPGEIKFICELDPEELASLRKNKWSGKI